ncbi:MAG: hypothetical protein HYR50_04955 [Candidatus Rokubacteria bacterium]|nr:hypothetical protein [Candidatus Rokubacteria bacterium]
MKNEGRQGGAGERSTLGRTPVTADEKVAAVLANLSKVASSHGSEEFDVPSAVLEKWAQVVLEQARRALSTPREMDARVETSIGDAYWKVRPRGAKSQGYLDRLQRARSWAFAANCHADDPDLRFICYWIALNALFGGFGWDARVGVAGLAPGGLAPYVNSEINEFCRKICLLDRNGLIAKALDSLTGVVDDVVRDKWHFRPYWEAGTTSAVERQIESKRKEARSSRREKRWSDHLAIALRRIEDIRDHLVHGSATYRVSKNRDSVNAALSILSVLVPKILEVVASPWAETAIAWPPVKRPRKDSPQHPESQG